MIDTGLKDKCVLLTGGNNPHGIGAATAKAFALQGAAVFIHYFRQPLELIDNLKDGCDFDTPGVPFFLKMQTMSAEEVVQAIRKQGGRVEAWEGNLADPDFIRNVC